MARTDDAEMTNVDRRNAVNFKTLGNCNYGRINTAKWKVCVLRYQLGRSLVILRFEIDNAECLASKRLQERRLCVSMNSTGKQLTYFGDDRSWNQPRTFCGPKQLDAWLMKFRSLSPSATSGPVSATIMLACG
jgi:hypothetical protein